MQVVLATMIGGTIGALILTLIVRAILAKRIPHPARRAATIGAIVYVLASVLWAFGDRVAPEPPKFANGFALYFFPTLVVTLAFAWRDSRRSTS